MTKLKFKIFRCRKTGRYFAFNQFYEDGYGEYQDSIDTSDISAGKLPALFQLNVIRKNLYKFTKFYHDIGDEVDEWPDSEIAELIVDINIE